MPADIILVDENDNPIGTGEKMPVHEAGQLHRAFSIFIFNKKGEMMLQKRASAKYHCPNLWTNTCCSHPRPDEDTLAAAHRRLREEMGFDCELKEIFSFIYKTKFDNGLTEHEFDHVLVGEYNEAPALNPEEAGDWKWVALDAVKKDIKKNPNNYTSWFKIALKKLLASQ